ncbi:hypothetical protein [Brucella tritici]|uniref:Uncharacterized protein n=1 Tax=Brucella tritici TaxID=94626 RepID=A0A6L3Y6H4_9HYPH|nr:hypothetical protein [Brucella tritici]KAB2675761.1 hypothetical protein F9L08_27455 [Brucella tritici]
MLKPENVRFLRGNSTILKSKNSDEDSVFGTKPISKKTFKVKGCAVYEDKQASSSNEEISPKAGGSFFNGSWSGSVGWMFVSAPMILNLRVSGNSVSGNSYAPSNGSRYEFSGGRLDAGQITYVYQQPSGDGPASVLITKKSANSISYTTTGGGINLSGTLTRGGK